MDKIKLTASLQSCINDWAEKEAQEAGWIDSLCPPNGIDLMTQAAINTLEAIEIAGAYTEKEMVK